MKPEQSFDALVAGCRRFELVTVAAPPVLFVLSCVLHTVTWQRGQMDGGSELFALIIVSAIGIAILGILGRFGYSAHLRQCARSLSVARFENFGVETAELLFAMWRRDIWVQRYLFRQRFAVIDRSVHDLLGRAGLKGPGRDS